MTKPAATPHPFGPPIWPSFDTLQKLLRKWARENSETVKVEIEGKSVEGRPVYAVRLTDPTADFENKEHVLITALHSGVERNGATTVFAIMEWLLSGEPLAQEILRRQVVVCMPVANPDCYVKGVHGRVYNEWSFDGPRDPQAVPEALAVQKIMDRYQPEVHADIHGMSMEFERYIMLENSACSYSNLALRPYHREIPRLMDEAALGEGYPSDWQESDSERMFWGPELDDAKAKLWVGRPQVYAANYCYNRYHSIVAASEVCWERSGLLRHRRLLEIGNAIWPSEYYPGYPTRVIASNNYHHIVAYGQTAAARRRSRVELWSKVNQLSLAMNDPIVEGKLVYVCAASPEATRQWLPDGDLQAFAARLADNPRVKAEPIKRFVAGWPHGQNYPYAALHVQRGSAKPDDAQLIQHGLALRVRIFFDKAQIKELLVNGVPIKRSETDGYVTWIARGMTYVQINIPPERLATNDLFVVTCEYDPGEKRTHWDAWRTVDAE